MGRRRSFYEGREGRGPSACKGAGGRAVAAGATRARWSARPPSWLLLAVVLGTAVQLIPVVAFPTVLTQDGPAHVYSAWILDHRGNPGPVGDVLREHFRIDLSPVPNMLTTFALAGLIPVVGPDVAERLLVAVIVGGLVAAVGWAARGVDRRAGWLAAGALPLAGSFLVVYGFYNFCLGVIGAVLVLGLGMRRRGGWSVRATAGLTVLLVGTWLAHLLPFLLAVAGIALLGLARAAREVRGGAAPWRAARRHLVSPAGALLPSAALTVVYLRSGAGPGGTPGGAPSVQRPLTLLAGIRPFAVGSRLEWLPAVAVAAALATLAVGARRGRPAGPGGRHLPERAALATLFAVVALVILLTPSHLGDDFGFLVDRLAWFPVLLALLWGATRLPGPRLTAALAAVLVVASTGLVLIRLPWQVATAGRVEEVLSVAPVLRPGSTFVVLRYVSAATAYLTPDPLRHVSSRLAVRARGVDVGLYEAAEPYFQVTLAGGPDLRRKLDPDLRGLERIPPVVDLPAVRGRLDYVLVVGLDEAGPRVRGSAPARAVREELAAHYERMVTSAPHGLVTVWRAKGLSAGGSA